MGEGLYSDNMLSNQSLLTINFFLKVFVYSEHNDKRGVHICNCRKEEGCKEPCVQEDCSQVVVMEGWAVDKDEMI